MLPPDNHVHTRWSWDTAQSSTMQRACAQATKIGLPAIAFTEHLDFTDWTEGAPGGHLHEVAERPGVRPLDVAGYGADVARCREMFPGLRIVSGIEAGEPHYFAAGVNALLATGSFERILGSLHAIPVDGRLKTIDDQLFSIIEPAELMNRYFTDMVSLVENSPVFGVLAHCDYPRRYWPTDRVGPYREADFEEHYRTVFRSLAASGRALEINTRSPLSSVNLIRWWWQEGGGAVSFGSDAHQPHRVGDGFDVAADVVEAAGFRPGRDQFDFWRR